LVVLDLKDKISVLGPALGLEGSVFTARRYASAVYAMAPCLSVSVCLFLSRVGFLLMTNLYILRPIPYFWSGRRSRKQNHTIARDSSFLMPKMSAKFDRNQPIRGRQMELGWVKMGAFRQIAGYISVQDRRTVFIKVE